MPKPIKQRARAREAIVRRRILDVVSDIVDALAPGGEIDLEDLDQLEWTISDLITVGVELGILPKSDPLLAVSQNGRVQDRGEAPWR